MKDCVIVNNSAIHRVMYTFYVGNWAYFGASWYLPFMARGSFTLGVF